VILRILPDLSPRLFVETLRLPRFYAFADPAPAPFPPHKSKPPGVAERRAEQRGLFLLIHETCSEPRPWL
jgi:hypothetical protein